MNKGLNKAIWGDDDTLDSDIQQKLLDIAADFLDAHVIPDESVTDIIITGSLANYNWSEYSDLDLHIVVNLDTLDDDPELLQHYYRLAKSVWNTSHEIDICGHEVEIYIQDAAEPHHSTGVYSVQDGDWLQKPKKDRGEPGSPKSVQKKYDDLVERINEVESKAESDDQSALDATKKLKDKIRRMRQSGLESGGEYSIENLAFKQLRNGGHLGRLSDAAKLAYDNQFKVIDCPAQK